MLCLPDEDAQRSALDGTDGVLAHIRPGQIVIELGTCGRAFKLEQAAKKDQGGILEPEHIADAYWMLHQQLQDARTHELDLRPFMEKY